MTTRELEYSTKVRNSAEIYEDALLNRAERALEKARDIKVWHAAKTRNSKQLELFQACPKEDYIPDMLSRVVTCTNCTLKFQCHTGKSNWHYFKEHPSRFQSVNSTLWGVKNEK